ncbi:unnamed protein product [Mytilus coruscus]|uniref:DZIP3-like HEPN domain-containing protein n=1 Tax=Mytilus coruscus TaxID=42192 RepID=A0A6J8D5S0_MYTCO|nr:unnamed protein product [Mytilus coruscus]
MASLSEEEENYVRLALLLKGRISTYLSTLNTKYKPQHSFGLKKKRIINQAQWNLLIPRNGVPDSKTFDVTLMICLIRNLTSINPPINGFDSLPQTRETTPGPDLARIKHYRNELAHHDSNTIDTTYFNTAWRDISDAEIMLRGLKAKTMLRGLKAEIILRRLKAKIMLRGLKAEIMLRGFKAKIMLRGLKA